MDDYLHGEHMVHSSKKVEEKFLEPESLKINVEEGVELTERQKDFRHSMCDSDNVN